MNSKLLFASWHCAIDPASGAALATRDLLGLLSRRGWDCRIFCGPRLDAPGDESVAQVLSDQRMPLEIRRATADGVAFSLLHFRDGACSTSVADCAGDLVGSLRDPMVRSRSDRATLSGTIYVPDKPGSREPTPEMGRPFLALFERVLERFRPDILLTWGGQPIAREMIRLARGCGVRVVFALHNFAYRDARLFDGVDAVLVPSRFCAEWYRRTLGLECTAISSPIDWSRVVAEDGDRHVAEARSHSPFSGRSRSDRTTLGYVTFVNPNPSKGLLAFGRIAVELGRLRPDIPLLIVEGRGKAEWLKLTGLDLSGQTNLHRMANTPDPRDFYRVSRLVLMPSLCNESFGRVAAEAMINGIPVLASNRGALPETVGDAGFLFDIPERYAPQTREVPSSAEVEPWVETIIRLWDDPEFYREASERAAERARQWHPDRLGPLYREFFESVRPQPVPPILPPHTRS